LSVGEKTLSYKNVGQIGFAAGQMDFQVTCVAGRVAVETVFDAWIVFVTSNDLFHTLSLHG